MCLYCWSLFLLQITPDWRFLYLLAAIWSSSSLPHVFDGHLLLPNVTHVANISSVGLWSKIKLSLKGNDWRPPNQDPLGQAMESLSPSLGCIVCLDFLETEIPASEHLHRFGQAAVVVTLPLWNGTEAGGGSTWLLLFNGELGERGWWFGTPGQFESPGSLECLSLPLLSLLLPLESIGSESWCVYIHTYRALGFHF